MESTNRQFGLLVAYLLPGFVSLGGIALLVPSIAAWLKPIAAEGTSGIGPPVYAVLAATAMGMTLSCIRWLVIDHLHAWTGLVQPEWNAKRLEDRLAAFNYLVEYHYRYYQFYANMLIAVLWTYVLNRWVGTSPLLGLTTDFGVFILCVILFAGSRDSLSKYYDRTRQLIGTLPGNGRH